MPEPFPPLSVFQRIRLAVRLFCGLRRHDFRIARTFVAMSYGEDPWIKRWVRFAFWFVGQVTRDIPDAMRHTRFANEISSVPVWLREENPFANYPWSTNSKADLPRSVDTVLIGCGLAGCAATYHWSRHAPQERKLIALDMADAASGSAGRNEGLIVMGRYYAMVYATVLPYLDQVRTDLDAEQRQTLARQFATQYCQACYRNADMVEQTIRSEGFECDYAREGWVQARDQDQQDSLAESVRMAEESGFQDWVSIDPEEVAVRTGMTVRHNAGFSRAAASFHPARWCWALLETALRSPSVEHYSRTRVNGVQDKGEHYLVQTDRGEVEARHVLFCTESYTPLLLPQFHDLICPTQTQAASGPGGPTAMKPHVGISGTKAFFGRHGNQTLVGSDATRVPDQEAGRNQPSRFLTHAICHEMQKVFGRAEYTITNEWSGTVTYTPDEFPIVGSIDGKRQYIVGGMAGSGTAVSFNGSRCIVNRILGKLDEQDDFPEPYFSPQRLLNPAGHRWPEVEKSER